MATFTVQNLSGVKLAVPPPVAKILAPGATAEVEAASLDTEAIADLINNNKIGIIPRAGGSVGLDAVEAAPKANAGLMSALIGGSEAGVTVANGETLTFTHSLGSVAVAVLVFDSATGAQADPATVTTGGDANTVTVANGSGGSLDLNVLVMFAPGTAPLGAVIDAADARIAVA